MPPAKKKPVERSRLFLDSIVENIPDMIFVKDAKDLRFVLFNRAGERLLGFSRRAMIGKNDYDFFPKTEADFFTSKDREVLRSGRLLDIPEEPIETKSGPRVLHTKKIPIRDEKGRPLFLLGISQDITEAKRRETQALEAQKLEAVGRLAGGIAHEFNNILTGVMGLAKLIEDEHLAAADDAREIAGQCRRAADLVSQLLAFSRRRPAARTKLDLNALVAGSRKLLTAALGKEIDLRLDLAAELPPVQADAAQLEQVLLNLCLNARDAMPEGGVLKVETRAVRLKEARAGRAAEIPPGRYVLLSVADDGCGIAEADKPRVFEPFFTTKDVGRGSGLGLAVVYGVVREHGGQVELDSAPGRGTTVRVYWPAAAGRATAAAGTRAAAAPSDLRGKETVLIAEDDRTARSTLTRFFKRLGYRVVEAADGRQAERRLTQGAGTIDAALLDLKMPKLDGFQVYKRTLRLNPRLKVLFMTGLAQTEAGDAAVRIGLPLLLKPLAPDAAARRIRQALDE